MKCAAGNASNPPKAKIYFPWFYEIVRLHEVIAVQCIPANLKKPLL